MSDISWKLFSHDDQRNILDLMAAYYEHDGLIFNRPKMAVLLEKFVNSPALGSGWLIYKAGNAVGYIVMTNGFSFEFGGFYQFLDEFFILQKERGNGIGAHTLAFVEAQGRARDVKSIHLEVEQDNEFAQRFYAKFGYRGHGRHLWSKELGTVRDTT